MLSIKRALVVAAHPDDEVLGVGGTIPLIKRQGGEVVVVIVTDGSSSQYPGNEEAVTRKKAQSQEANQILGTDEVLYWNFPDMRLDTVEHITLNNAFSTVINQYKFDTVFVQNGDDVNLDHQLIYKSVMVATRPVPNQPVNRLLSYQVNSSTEWGGRTQTTIFCPNVFLDISLSLELKIDAMKAYVDELRPFPHPRSLESIRHKSVVTGNEVGFKSAEAFKLLLYKDALKI